MDIPPDFGVGRNKRLVRDYLADRKAEGVSETTLENYEQHLRRLESVLGKPFDEAGRRNIRGAVNRVRDELAESTADTFVIITRRFYKWLNRQKTGEDEYPEEVAWLSSTRRSNKENVLPNEILSQSEVKELVNSCDSAHDRALIAALYESAARRSEFLALNISSVNLEEGGKMGYIVIPNNASSERGLKTGQRRVPVAYSLPYLQTWINNHPRAGESAKVPLWLSADHRRRHERLSGNGLYYRLQKISGDTEFGKHLHPHLFRHSRATHIAQMGFSEAAMRRIFGWTRDSEMPSKYVHIAGRDIDSKFKREHGIEVGEEEKVDLSMEPRTCPRCENRNPATAKYCNTCGLVLDEKVAIELDRKRKLGRYIQEKAGALEKTGSFDELLLAAARRGLMDLLGDEEIEEKLREKYDLA